jgi:DNA (cytosine-5)-methyltransferase 1
MPRKKLIVADLFCGAGGTSTGVSQFCESVGLKLDLVAVNHWDRAVETHAANHPRAAHFCQDLTRLKPAEAVPGGKLDLLVASPECTHHSNARGGKPKNDQSRASAWVVLEWVNALKVDRVLIENVPEFTSWGPLGADGKPLKSKRGDTFRAFVKALEASGYRVAYKTLNAADYGAATSRRRMFIQAVRGRQEIRWPNPTHERNPNPGLFGSLPRWRAAREIIDWNLSGESIFTRKRPLSENTMKRIEAGLRKFGGAAAEPFLVAMNYLKERRNDGRATISIDDPIPTITSQGNRFAFIVPTNYGERPGQSPRHHSLDSPVPTVVAGGVSHAVVEPFIADMRGTDPASLEKTARDLNEPHPTITAGGSHTALIEPFLMHTTHHGGDRVHSPDGPIPTVTGANRGEQAVVQPFLLPHRKFQQMDTDGVDRPVRTIDATNGGCNALIVPYYGSGVADSTADPLATVTAKDRFGLVEPEHRPVGVDIRFRMLQPHELAAAMGFPRDYKITGNRAEQVRQVGNAVEVHQARALATAALGGRAA